MGRLKRIVTAMLAVVMVFTVTPTTSMAAAAKVPKDMQAVYFNGYKMLFPHNSWQYSQVLSNSTGMDNTVMYFAPDSKMDISIDSSSPDTSYDRSNIGILYLASFKSQKDGMETAIKAAEQKFDVESEKVGTMFGRDTYRITGDSSDYSSVGIVVFTSDTTGMIIMIEGNDCKFTYYSDLIDNLYKPGYMTKAEKKDPTVYKEKWLKDQVKKSSDGKIFYAGRYPKVKVYVKSCRKKKDDIYYTLRSTKGLTYYTSLAHKKGQKATLKITDAYKKNGRYYADVY